MAKNNKCVGLCEPCQDNYSKTGITMAEIKKDLEYIKKSLSDNSVEHKAILEAFEKAMDSKADKEDVKWLKNVVYTVAGTIILALFGIIWWLLQKYLERNI